MAEFKYRYPVVALILAASTLVDIGFNEGFEGKAKPPVPGDRDTYGFGATTRADGSPVRAGDTITPERALVELYKQVEGTYAAAVKRCLTAPVTLYEYASLIDGSYNAGTGAICRSPMIAKFNAGDYEGACEAFSGWRETVNGKSCRDRANGCYGLVNRRNWERDKCKGKFDGVQQ